ncbi:MAG: hypothetical protein ACOVQ8_08590 [Elstera sp.]
MSLTVLEFDRDDIQNTIAKLSDGEIDSLAFGAIELDKTGKVLRFNAMEGQITGRDPKQMVARIFSPMLRPAPIPPTSKAASMRVLRRAI